MGEDIIADYLLYSLNRLEKFRCKLLTFEKINRSLRSDYKVPPCLCVSTFSYVEKYDLEQPSDDIQFVLKHIAVKLRKTQRVKAITGVGKKKKPGCFALCFKIR